MEQKTLPFSRSEKVCLTVILLLAVLSRTVLLDKVPGGLHQDEAMAGYNALTLLRSGRDSFGNPWPVYFTAWGSGMNVLESLLQIPCLALLGVNELAVRLPIAIFSLLSLLALFDLVRRCSDNQFALFILFLASITPWQVMMSRWALESNLAPLFILFGVYFFVKGLDHQGCFILSALCYGLSLYAYATVWPVVPLILLMQILYAVRLRKICFSGWTASAVILLALLALPLFLFLLVNNKMLEEIRLPFITIPRMVSYRGNELLSDSIFTNLNNLIHVLTIGAAEPWHALNGYGLYYYISLPFILFGFCICLKLSWKALKTRQFTLDFFMLTLIIAGLIQGLLIRVDIKRVNIIHFAMIFCEGRALWFLIQKFRFRILVPTIFVYFLLFASFEYSYFGPFRAQVGNLFQEGCGEALTFVKKNLANYNRVYLDLYWSPIGLPYSKAFFYLEEDVNTLTETVVYNNAPDPFLEVASFDRYVLDFQYTDSPDLSAAYLLKTEADGSPLVRQLEENGYIHNTWGIWKVYYLPETGSAVCSGSISGSSECNPLKSSSP